MFEDEAILNSNKTDFLKGHTNILTHIHAEMEKDSVMLQGIIEIHETYIGCKPCKENKKG